MLQEQIFDDWFASKGWVCHPHQIELFQNRNKASQLLIAPTGGGKTLAGFLPTLNELQDGCFSGLHTIYVSPLKALASDIRRNLGTPIDELNLPIRVETRTGDTSQAHRKRQRADPPHILLTTPESLALLLSYEDAPRLFSTLQRVIVDEIHALAENKRGDQLLLCLSRLQTLAPSMRRIGLSATVENPQAMAEYLACHPDPCEICFADPGPDPNIEILETKEAPPWNGAGAAYAIPAVLERVKTAKTTLIFINTRAQAEIFFHGIWRENSDNLPIALHHGSMSREARDRVEAAMIAGQLRAIVCTGTLDLGIDWGDVDLVIQIGAPKNVKRLVQRIGRANHQYNAPSRAILVPANRFEVIECRAALEAALEKTLDGDPRGDGPRDVLCQHILATACAGPFDAEALCREVQSAGPYKNLSQDAFAACLDFCATGGYALRRYDRWQRLQQSADGLWHLRDPRAAKSIRMNLGTIIDTETLPVRLKNRFGGKPLGEVEEAFAATLTAGETFLIGGEVVRYEGLREMTVVVTRDAKRKPRIAVFSGTKFSTSTLLNQRVMRLMKAENRSRLPKHTAQWLDLQQSISKIPTPDRMLVESYPLEGREFTCFYGFAGQNAMQTLGLMLTQKMEASQLYPMGFVASDYILMTWGLKEVSNPAELLDKQTLSDGFDNWLAGNAVMKRTFRDVATIAGLIDRNFPGRRKSGRQATFSTDILYDTIRKHDPEHLMMKITHEEAQRGLVDYGRIEEMLDQFGGKIDHVRPGQITPLSAPLHLEVGKVPIKGQAEDRLILKAAEDVLSLSKSKRQAAP